MRYLPKPSMIRCLLHKAAFHPGRDSETCLYSPHGRIKIHRVKQSERCQKGWLAMAKKKNKPVPVSQEDNIQAQQVLEHYHQVAQNFLFFFQAEDGIRDSSVTGVQTCALPISSLTIWATCCPTRRITPLRADCSSDKRALMTCAC